MTTNFTLTLDLTTNNISHDRYGATKMAERAFVAQMILQIAQIIGSGDARTNILDSAQPPNIIGTIAWSGALNP
jgi:hypothetical protein